MSAIPLLFFTALSVFAYKIKSSRLQKAELNQMDQRRSFIDRSVGFGKYFGTNDSEATLDEQEAKAQRCKLAECDTRVFCIIQITCAVSVSFITYFVEFQPNSEVENPTWCNFVTFIALPLTRSFFYCMIGLLAVDPSMPIRRYAMKIPTRCGGCNTIQIFRWNS